MREFLDQDCRGNIAVIGAMLTVPILGLVGGSVDYMTASNSELRLQQVLDAAAFEAARPVEASPAERKAIADAYLASNLPDQLRNVPRQVDVDELTNGVSATASLTLDTNFLQIVGITSLDIRASARVSFDSGRPLEMVLLMDTTNSMKSISGGWNQAVESIEGLLSKVINELDPAVGKSVSIVPFTDRVNIGTDRAAWLDGPPPSDWKGCVEPREEKIGTYDYALDDDNYLDEPFNATIRGVTGGLASRGGGYPNCGPAITGPTDQIDTLETALSNLYASGTGRFDEALAWGWRLLSPQWRGAWGDANYPADQNKAEKFIALFTDGHTTAYHFETVPFPATSGIYNDMTPEAGELFVDLCRRIQAEKIKIFVFYVKGSSVSRPYFKDCVNNDDRFFEVGGVDELTAALTNLVSIRGRMRLAN